MARALIVGCGCRGRSLGARLIETGWQVRGTTRSDSRLSEIEAAGIEAVVADPDRVGTIVEQLESVAVVVWLMGSALDAPDAAAALNGPRLERMLEKVVDSPVRGFVYEAAGGAGAEVFAGGADLVAAASERWRIPVRVVGDDPGAPEAWLGAMRDAVEGVLAG